MTTLPDRIDEILNGLDLGYRIKMSDYASNQRQSLDYKKAGLAELEAARDKIVAEVEEAIGEDEVITSEDYAMANARMVAWDKMTRNGVRQFIRAKLGLEGPK